MGENSSIQGWLDTLLAIKCEFCKDRATLMISSFIENTCIHLCGTCLIDCIKEIEK